VSVQVQGKMEQMLAVKRDEEDTYFPRFDKYKDGKTPNLSEFKGISQCAEQVLVAKYLLDKAGMKSVYCSGITMNDPENPEEFPEDHSFLIMPNTKGGTYVFDVARPKSSYNL